MRRTPNQQMAKRYPSRWITNDPIGNQSLTVEERLLLAGARAAAHEPADIPVGSLERRLDGISAALLGAGWRMVADRLAVIGPAYSPDCARVIMKARLRNIVALKREIIRPQKKSPTAPRFRALVNDRGVDHKLMMCQAIPFAFPGLARKPRSNAGRPPVAKYRVADHLLIEYEAWLWGMVMETRNVPAFADDSGHDLTKERSASNRTSIMQTAEQLGLAGAALDEFRRSLKRRQTLAPIISPSTGNRLSPRAAGRPKTGRLEATRIVHFYDLVMQFVRIDGRKPTQKEALAEVVGIMNYFDACKDRPSERSEVTRSDLCRARRLLNKSVRRPKTTARIIAPRSDVASGWIKSAIIPE